MGRLLGIDYGSSKVGVALADEETRLASPIEVIQTKDAEKQLARIMEIIKTETPTKIIIGLPLGKDGQPLAQTGKVKGFVSKLEAACGRDCQLIMEDERFSTKMSKKLLSEVKAGPDDAVAAAVILQGYLDRRK